MKSLQLSNVVWRIQAEPPPSLTLRRRSQSMSRRYSVKGARFTFLYNLTNSLFALDFKDYCYKRLRLNKTNLLISTIPETQFALNCGHRPKLWRRFPRRRWETLLFEDKASRKTFDMARYCSTKINCQNEYEYFKLKDFLTYVLNST